METTQEMQAIVDEPPDPSHVSLRGHVPPCYLRAAVIILPVRITCITGHSTALAATMQVEWT